MSKRRPAEKSPQQRLTLYVNRMDSKCGNCGRGADPHAECHDEVLCYAPIKPEGCHVRWRYVSTHYSDEGGLHQRISEMRPDLIPLGLAAQATPSSTDA